MIRSMTGFGKARVQAGNRKVVIELRSLNSKQLDLNFRLPSAYREKENELRSLLSNTLVRGKVDIQVSFEEQGTAPTAKLNFELAKAYKNDLHKLSEELGEKNNTSFLPLVLKMPDVLKPENSELNEKEWKEFIAGFNTSIHSLNTFRQDEGKVLAADLTKRLNLITQKLTELETPDRERVKKIKNRLINNLSEVLGAEKFDKNKLEEEMVYYIEKLDITEEKTRLKTHCDYFIDTMKEDNSGRKLGFITQEIGREINTIGSKANDATIQKMVVEMKDELEKIKEQVNNIL